jgi:hypothetical protein
MEIVSAMIEHGWALSVRCPRCHASGPAVLVAECAGADEAELAIARWNAVAELVEATIRCSATVDELAEVTSEDSEVTQAVRDEATRRAEAAARDRAAAVNRWDIER